MPQDHGAKKGRSFSLIGLLLSAFVLSVLMLWSVNMFAPGLLGVIFSPPAQPVTSAVSSVLPQASTVVPWLIVLLLIGGVILFRRSRKAAIPASSSRFQLMDAVNGAAFMSPHGLHASKTSSHVKELRISARKAGTVGLAVMSAFLISVASFWTTFIGTLSFFGYTPFQVLFGFILALGIQITLFLASWFVAEEMTTRQRQPLAQSMRTNGLADPGEQKQRWFVIEHFGKVAILLICMLASIFFSFSAHFENVYGSKRLELANLQNARADTQQVITSTEQAIRDERNAESKRLTEQDASWKQFESELNRLLTMAESRPEDVRNAMNSKRIAAEGEIAKTQREIEEGRKEIARINREIEAVNARAGLPTITGSAENIDGLARKVEELRAEKTRLEVARQIEINGEGNLVENLPPACQAVKSGARTNSRGGRTGKGVGPVARCLGAELADITPKLASAERELAAARKRREDTLTSASRSAEQIAQFKASRETVTVKLDRDEAWLKDQQRALDEIKGQNEKLFASSGSHNEVVKNIRRDRDDFLRTGSKPVFDRMIANCANLVEIMQSVKDIAGDVSGNACNTAGFSATIDRMTKLDEALVAYSAQCVIDARFNAFTRPSDYVNYGSTCIALAKVPNRTAKESALINEIAQLNHPDASNFERSIASLARGDRLAWLAIALAIAVDIVVFLSAVLGASANSSIFLRKGHVTSNEDLKDLLAGQVDPTIFGDEPNHVRLSKLFLTSVRLEQSSRSNQPFPVHVIDLNSADNRDKLPLSNIINNAAASGLAEAVRGRPLVYEIDHDMVKHHSRVVWDFEEERMERHGPRKIPHRPAENQNNAQPFHAIFQEPRRSPASQGTSARPSAATARVDAMPPHPAREATGQQTSRPPAQAPGQIADYDENDVPTMQERASGRRTGTHPPPLDAFL